MRQWVISGIAAAIIAALIIAWPYSGKGATPANEPAPIAGSTVKISDITGHGSGVHIGGGYIITARHVIAGDTTVTVKDDKGREREGTVLWSNEPYDVALVRVDPANLASSHLDCRDPVVGERVHAVGNPITMEFIRTWGTIAGAARKLGRWESVLVVDETVAGGMSGGPIFDRNGSVVAIVVGVAQKAPITAAVPSSVICGLLART